MKKDKHVETFVKNVNKHRKCDKIAFLVAYFYKQRNDFYEFEKWLLTLNKFKKIFANLCKNAKNSIYADATHSYCKAFFANLKNESDNKIEIEEKDNVARGLTIKIKIRNFLYFTIHEYVAVDKSYFNIELVFGKFKNKTLYTFTTLSEIFAVYNLTNYAIKYNILDKNDKALERLYTKSLLKMHMRKKDIKKILDEQEKLLNGKYATKLEDVKDESCLPF